MDTFITLEDRIVFSFEVKVDRSSEVGERQIKENYFQRYLADPKTKEIYLISLNFSRKHSELESALVEKVERPSSLGPETIETKKIFYWNASPDLLLYKRKL